jgi:hypothetical protein
VGKAVASGSCWHAPASVACGSTCVVVSLPSSYATAGFCLHLLASV